jgi:hypothetical protein
MGNFAPSLLGIVYGQQASISNQILGEGGISSTGSTNGEILSTLIANAVCAGYLLSAVCFTMSAMTTTARQEKG